MKIEIKKFQKSDWWRFVKTVSNTLVGKTLYIHPINLSKRKHKTAFFKYLENNPEYFYKIEVDGKYAGVCCISNYFHNDLNKFHYYEWDKYNIWYAIRPKFWNKGITSYSINLLIKQYLFEGNTTPLKTTVLKNNQASINCLIKNGFIHIQTVKNVLIFEKTFLINPIN